MSKLIDITGQKFGRLTVLEKGRTHSGMVFWKCLCECGKEIEASSGHLRYGHTKSCGCYAEDLKRHPNKFDLSNNYGICYFNNGDGYFIFDKEDYDKIKDYCWAKTSVGYAMSTKFKGKATMLHRLIMDCPDNLVVDHINHDTLDNRKCNLRVCTHQQNHFNVKGKGVRRRKNGWEASITCNGVYHYLGKFQTEEEAAIARKEAEKDYFGEYAYKEG